MGANARVGRRIVQILGSLKTGITLLIVVGATAAAGTVILQRPVTSPAVMEMRYSPSTLKALDALGLTNIYHAWWFIVLLALVATSIIFASIERWPNAWRFYRRPYRKPDQHFRNAHPTKIQFSIIDSASALAATERAMRRVGFYPQRVRQDSENSLYVEKNRFAVLAVYVVHISLLLIFLGGIMDGIWGFKGDIQLTPAAEPTDRIELRDKTVKTLPFSIRCDGAGQENYTGEFAGMPKRWWSKLTLLEEGREVLHKDIEVNDPLVYKGVRFYQSGFGMSDKPETYIQVSYEPGQWAVWTGCLLMATGLIISFYVVHMRFWAITVNDGKGGLVLWVGAAANKKNREPFEQKFRDLKGEIAGELASAQAHEAPELAAATTGK